MLGARCRQQIWVGQGGSGQTSQLSAAEQAQLFVCWSAEAVSPHHPRACSLFPPFPRRYGKRPLSGGMCPGVEEALRTMKAGGQRRVTVPPELGFGDRGLTLRPTEHVPGKAGEVPPGATLEYELSLVRVSIPPS